MNLLNKQAIRRHASALRSALAPSIQKMAQADILVQIKNLAAYLHAEHIAFYHAINGEIDLSPLLHATLARNSRAYLPKINLNGGLDFLPVNATTTMTRNRFHIPEPDVPLTEARLVAQIELLFIPLLAFDKNGTRLGYGGGYYDRTLAHSRPRCVLGVAYASQYQPNLPHDHWDVRLDGIVTEQEVIWVA